jgi:tetratricopeptide (TPR) repeat protein
MAKTRAKKKDSSPTPLTGITFPFAGLTVQSLVLIGLGLLLYANSFTNLYALDDGIVVQKNKYVQEGFRGIPRILATDVYDSYYSEVGAEQQLFAGRYRPLSLVTFALEQQLFGSKDKAKPADDIALARHFMNVFLYILSVVFLLQLLRRYILPHSPYVAFFACLLFLIHPLHTEVIANVKSRDEILSFLFIVLTLAAVFRYREGKKTSQLACGLVCYFLALLSKEYAVSLIALIPLLLFVVKRDTLADCIKAVWPFLAIAITYLALRFSIVGIGSTQANLDVLNNPYKFATNAESWATRLEILNRYLKLLLFPYPLSCDYSYRAIPYKHFTDPEVWLSIALHLSMIAATILLFIRRNLLAFALAFYLIHLFLVSNLVFDIGATMGERLVYHSSFGFALAVALLLERALQKTRSATAKSLLSISLSVLLIPLAGAIVVPRNRQWRDDPSLFLTDVKTVPDSALLNGNAGKVYLELSERPENKAQARELATKSIPFSEKAVRIHNGYFNGYFNLGAAYAKLGDLEKAEEYWSIGQEIYPDHPYLRANFNWLGLLYYNKAMLFDSENAPEEAILWLEKAVRVDPRNADSWYKLGDVCFRTKDFARAKAAWTKTLQLKPDYKEAELGISALPAQ